MSLDSLKKLVDKMAFYKQNQFQLYIEHIYLFRDLTEVFRDDTPLTAEEILELDKYCYERGIELVPSLATFGHLCKLLKTKSYEKCVNCLKVIRIFFRLKIVWLIIQ